MIVSLPREWVNANQMKKGDVVFIEEMSSGGLHISAMQSESSKSSVTIDCCKLSDGLVDFINHMADNPWSWEVEMSEDEFTTHVDTMFYADDQLIVHGDTTLHLIDRNVGVTSFDNVILPDYDANMKLDAGYLDHFINRTIDWRQDRNMDFPEHVDNVNWLYQADGNPLEVQWPLNIDMRYSAYSEAAYMSKNIIHKKTIARICG